VIAQLALNHFGVFWLVFDQKNAQLFTHSDRPLYRHWQRDRSLAGLGE
jgi:hypothetical protein